MAVSFASYEIARSGLFVNERGLDVTGHNIANVNTAGYVRQQAIITTGPYQNDFGKNGPYQLGLGASIEQVRQIRHTFLDNIYRQENTTLGYWESKNKTFQDVQAILGEPMGSGLQDVMNQFWDSWQELSKEPDSLTVRALVRQRGEALAQQINHIGAQMDKEQDDLNSEIQVRVDEVNGITKQIADLNVEILKVETSKDTANDYRDQRNSMVDRLTKLLDVDVNEMEDGELTITAGGYFLVNKGVSTKMTAETNREEGLFYVPKLEGTDIQVPLKSGIIKGLMESRGEVFGATGSVSNGSPFTKADVTFVIDNTLPTAQLDKIKNSVQKYVDEISRKGVDCNLRLVTYGNSASYNSKVYSVTGTSGVNDLNAFVVDVGGISNSSDINDNFGSTPPASTDNVLSMLSTMNGSLRQDANKYAVVFTGESLDGNETTTSDISTYINALNGLGMKTSVVTDTNYFDTGDTSAEKGWNAITGATGGRLYDINSSDYDAMMTTIGMDNVNDGTTYVPQTNNIIPDLRKRLNALVNVMAREVNAAQRSGITLDGKPGKDFFTPIDDGYPMQLGNIQLNINLSDMDGLNNIVASKTGASGDNTVALKIANLRNQSIMRDLNGPLSMDDYYQSTILSVGSGGSDADRITQNQMQLVNSADAYRQSITGVSMDEEMTNMMKYKYAYDAASRCINTIDEMIETVISRMGLVGR